MPKNDSVQAGPTLKRARPAPVQPRRVLPLVQPRTSTPLKLDPDRARKQSAQRTLWILVSVSIVIIILAWVGLVGRHLSQTAKGDETLYERIKREIQQVFGKKEDSQPVNGKLTPDEVKALEDRVFPNINENSTSVNAPYGS
jgi:hypothetical protein